jgi:hypothetical protein
MKSIHVVFLSFLFAAGCATFQEPVDEAMLNEMNQQEKNRIEEINKQIIAKKADKDAAEKNVAISEQKVIVNTARLALIEAQKTYLLKREKLFVLSDNKTRLTDTRKAIDDNDRLQIQELENQNYCNTKKDADIAAFKVKESELSVVVSQLDYEKAKIAREYQIRRYGADYDKLVDTKKFGDYYNAQQDTLNNRKQYLQKSLEAVKSASDKLKAIGYEEQK